MSQATREDVELCLRLYEQRREPVLREAREWMNRFAPSSFAEVQAVMTGQSGLEANRFWRQATSYWEMICGLMLSDGVSPACRDLFVGTTKEFMFCFSKVEPFLAEIRASAQPTTLQNLERLSRSQPEYERIMTYFRNVNERMRSSQLNNAPASKKTSATKEEKKGKKGKGKSKK